MNILVLLSAGRHPASGAPRPVPVELQAIGLALALPGAVVTGLHAGADDDAVADALGHGLDAITVLAIGSRIDPLPALAAEIAALKPDLVLAGRRGMGGADGGLLPYRLARACSLPIIADAMAIEPAEATFAVTQAMKRGARRRVVVARPAVVTVHEAAPSARPFIHRARIAGQIMHRPGERGVAEAQATAIDIRPYRARPKLIGDGIAGSAEERLQAATETRSVGGRLMIDPDPNEAAAAILDYVARFRPVG